jgi:hypothetical protein
MINNDRIVSITKIDLISNYGLMLVLSLGESAPEKIDAKDVDGNFVQATNNKTVLCSEPVKTFDFASTATAGTVYFVPALDYAGFTTNCSTPTVSGDTVAADGRSLYSATLSSGTVTFAKIGF